MSDLITLTGKNGREVTMASGQKLFIGLSNTGAPAGRRDPSEHARVEVRVEKNNPSVLVVLKESWCVK